MRLTRFNRLLDLHGADLARWPARERAAAWQLVAARPEARAALDAARRLDALLARDPAPPAAWDAPSIPALLARLPAQQTPYWWPAPVVLWDLLPAWPRATALAAMAVVGILVGLTDVDITPAPAASADVSSLIFDPNPAIGLAR
ncbi:MAG: hypothetical protein JO021_05680 [Alphaproteobacteria bacterium]|nr:hypothetical protein [Alphaproteobacteria bacterium]